MSESTLDDHELKYRPRTSGLAHLDIPDNLRARWVCSCGQWEILRELSGCPFRETAVKRHREHVNGVHDNANY